MKRAKTVVLTSFVLMTAVSFAVAEAAADWPVYGGDNNRSFRSDTQLKLPLAKVWEYGVVHAPSPAFRWVKDWRGGPKKGGFSSEQLSNWFRYDFCHTPIIADGRLYFSSSTEV